ncbi:MAG: NAD(P)/FAD-dependent oxidoreductase [Phycisphaerales bacterium JB064]
MLVERSAYDDALLGHVRELGAQVIDHATVANVATVENRIAGLVLDDGRCVVGRRYLDASGPAAVLARALGVGTHRVASLDHRMISGILGNARGLEDPAFHVRMHVRTLPYGWVWVLPLSGDRLAFGVVVPAQVLDQAGSPETLASRALADHPDIASMTNGANPLTSWRVDDATPTCAQRLVGENWLLCGGAAGISEPILMAELMLTHTTGREAGYTLAALHMGLHDAGWLLQGYADKVRRHFDLHARLAQLWYAGNRQMVEHAAGMQALAASAGLKGNAQHAWSWLMQGGFTATSLVQPQVGSHDIGGARALVGMLTEGMPAPSIALQQFNVVKPNLVGAKQEYFVDFRAGAVHCTPCYVRDGRILPMIGVYERLLEALKRSTVLAEVLDDLRRTIQSVVPLANQGQALSRCIQALEAMLQDGWLIAKHDHRRPIPRWTVNTPSPIRDLASTTRTQPEAETTPKQAIR